MTLDQLRIFVEVAQRQHLTQAASALFLSPSAVSSSIKALEERYGTALFHRIGRRIELSDAGLIFLIEAQRTLASARAAENTLSELGQMRRGTLAIHASQTIASYWLPRLLVQFSQTYPAIDLTLEVGNTDSVAQAILLGGADLGFIEGDIDEPSLAIEAVGEDQLVVVVAPDHPWSAGVPLAAADLVQAQWILRETGSGTRSAFEKALSDMGVPVAAMQVALSLPSNEAVRSAVMAGPFATAISELVVASHVQAGLLARAALVLPARGFSMLRHPERHRSRAALAFEELMNTKK
ncbi:LysR substrate-binding domain-containing protein [Massilia aurea]|jgi:DNA-binding transcriptional LysR family regulator|uniref:HTH-type transcriptional regulator CysL n=2 Tax=Telluria group TaxID=2895353 RepID=A0A1E7X7P2_9BURK|nr:MULTISPECIES: LysR substrate-binding domain-containing protein [Pseudomonadota]MBD8544456.1 LysR family transcriptional regulator [Oxalobacteraceae sp. CFBP 8761]MBD8565619.1 LysR family transcriptional regulator [Oxalobacteraceae sp. CFBP 8763]MBD8628453.1 LysR family transcriptional regulator [Oxalobacteraceae sp. CFBP 8753]MBD8633301.1 LysR family transcriptional regulator [Oxalobacteraceae sp. CFBP 8755]MBD8654098.1 LysR family transcriptional regulator [Oxalobacteraceae sp. CFBP 13730]